MTARATVKLIRYFSCLWVIAFPPMVSAQNFPEIGELISLTVQSIETGDTALTIQYAEQLEPFIDGDIDSKSLIAVLRVLGEAYVATGRRGSAARYLRLAAENALDISLQATAKMELLEDLASQLRGLGIRNQSAVLLSEAVAIAESVGDYARVVSILTEAAAVEAELDNLRAAEGNLRYALEVVDANDYSTRAELYAQLIKLLIRFDAELVAGELGNFEQQIAEIDDDLFAAGLKLQLAGALVSSTDIDLEEFSPVIEEYLNLAEIHLAASNQNQGYVNGYRGSLRYRQGRFTEALALTRTALQISAAIDEANQSYRWNWQIARVQAAQNQIDSALTNYSRAIDILTEFQTQLLNGTLTTFQERVTPLYMEYIDLLLTLAVSSQDQNLRSGYLLEVQATLEAFNKSEVLDYFDDDCILPSEFIALDSVAADTAVIYSIILDDRVSILIRFSEGLRLYTVDVDPVVLSDTVLDYRDMLEFVTVNDNEMQSVSQQLFDWLVRPYIGDLKRLDISKLVYITSSVLRPIPMSALYSGERYLIEDFAVVNSLGLELTDSRSERDNGEILLAGVSEAVFDFIALDNVERELAGIAAISNSETLLNQQFSLEAISNRLSVGNYATVHLATHGYFDRDPSQSFILAYDGRLNLDSLQETVGIRRYAGQPLDLLVLSACETASGDERAVLGLVGVSLKAGARSTLGSLWTISDEATSELMVAFYQALNNGRSKAEALRVAQLGLLGAERFRHPNFWSPFLLVGNWY